MLILIFLHKFGVCMLHRAKYSLPFNPVIQLKGIHPTDVPVNNTLHGMASDRNANALNRLLADSTTADLHSHKDKECFSTLEQPEM